MQLMQLLLKEARHPEGGENLTENLTDEADDSLVEINQGAPTYGYESDADGEVGEEEKAKDR